MATKNILKETNLTYDIDFSLDDEWYTLANRLGLNSMQTYFVWLWLDTAYDMTFERTQNLGNKNIGLIG